MSMSATEKAIESARVALVAACEGSLSSAMNLLNNRSDDIRYLARLEVMNQGIEQLQHAATLLTTAQRVAQAQELTIKQLREWATRRTSVRDAELQTTEQRVDDAAEAMHAGHLTDEFLAHKFQVIVFFALSKWSTINQRTGACHIYYNYNYLIG